jgi:ribosomal protein S27AE
MNEQRQPNENLKRCPACGEVTLSLHAKARTWLCRNCGYQEPLPEGEGGGSPEQSTQQSAQQDS